MVIDGIDERALGRWFEEHIEGALAPLRFELITGGRSNLTFTVDDAAGHRFVLRRPPTGAVIATAHDVGREHRIISALAESGVPVPPALGFCEDEAVNGAPFYVMTFVPGVVLADESVTAKLLDEEGRGHYGRSVVEVLARLHGLDPDAVGLGTLGRKEAYLERQLKRWRTQWEKTKTRELAAMEDVYIGLQERRPEQIGVGIVHGDYRPGNMLVRASGEIAAVLDWELCTLGDPLADLGYLLNSWAEPGDRDGSGQQVVLAPTLAAGFPARAELIERYQELTGRDASGIAYYQAFQYWRLAAICEGVLARFLKGVMGKQSLDTDGFRKQVDGLAAMALEQLEGLG